MIPSVDHKDVAVLVTLHARWTVELCGGSGAICEAFIHTSGQSRDHAAPLALVEHDLADRMIFCVGDDDVALAVTAQARRAAEKRHTVWLAVFVAVEAVAAGAVVASSAASPFSPSLVAKST